MGGELEKLNGKADGSINEERTTGTGTGNSGNSASTTNPDNGGRNGGTGGSGSGSGGRTTAEKEVVPVVVAVNDGLSEAERKKEERNAKRRERYAKQKAENGGSVKPRKVNAKKPEPVQTVSTEQINALVMTISVIVASRPNCEHWQLSESEVDAITKPLMNIVAESEALAKLGENSNQIALGVACVSVFAPRIMVTIQKAKAEKEKKKNAERKVAETERSIKELNKGDNRKPAPHAQEPSNDLSFLGSLVG